MKKSVLTSFVLVLLVGLTACGGSEEEKKDKDAGPTKSEVVDSFTKAFSSTATGALNEKEATCFATEFVDKAGVARLLDSKLVDEDGSVQQEDAVFDETLATQFAEAFLGCVDYTAKQAAVIAASDKKINEKKLADCLDEALPNDFVTRFIVSSYLNGKDVETLRAQSAARMEKCRDSATTK